MRWFQWSPVNFNDFNSDSTVCRVETRIEGKVLSCDISFWAILQKSVPVYRIYIGEMK
jgi:hypothetical protein